MDDKAVEEASRLGLLECLGSRPASEEELARVLGISERVIVGLMDRLVSQGIAEQVPCSAGTSDGSPVYRLAQRRRARSGNGSNGGVPHNKAGRFQHTLSTTAAQQAAAQQQAVMLPAVMPPYPYPPFHPHQLLYYPASLSAFQQQSPMSPQWAMQGLPSGQRRQQPQQPGMGVGAGISVASLPRPQPLPGFAMQPYFYATASGAAMVAPPHTPTQSGGHPRMPQLSSADSASSLSVGSTGWGGVPLSRAPAEVLAAPASSPRSLRSQQDAPPSSSMRGSGPRAAAASNVPLGKDAGSSTSLVQQRQQQQQEQQISIGAEAVGQAGPGGSEDESDREGIEEQPRDGSGDASGGESAGNGLRGGSSGGSSAVSRRSRASREPQACAFFLKTGTCAYGDNCKFLHPLDQAPRVEFNSWGLPLRPGEPQCTFYMKNCRCAFGHTCKFHHPEPSAVFPGLAPGGFAMQYPMQYQGITSPTLNSVLGLKPGPAGGPSSATPGGLPAASFMAPYPAAFPGTVSAFSMRGSGPTPGLPGGPSPGPINLSQRSSSATSKSAAAVAASAASTAAAALPPRLPAKHGEPPAPPVTLAPPQQLPLDSRASTDDASGEAPTAADVTVPANAALSQLPGPQPIMVFNSQNAEAKQMASALQELDLAAGDSRAHKRGPSSGTGDAGGLPDELPQEQMAAVATM